MAQITGTTTYPAGVATWVRNAGDLSGGKKLTVNGVTYDCSYCGDFAVYYVGKKGGWNSFLFEGPCKRVDNLTDYKMSKPVPNTSIKFSDSKYMVEISPDYELKTGWLSDEESVLFASDLISSPKVYLHNLITGEIMPAVITSNSAEYKTFKNTGRKFVQHTLMITLSQKQYRR